MEHSRILRAGNLTDDTRLYRYVSLSQFLSFIETDRTCLTRVRDWEDTWEIPSRRLPFLSEANPHAGPMQEVFNTLYGQCWSLAFESDAMWRIYSQNREGLMLQTTVGRFDMIKTMRHALLAPVVYYDNLYDGLARLSELGYPDPFALALLKRKAFEHEKEVRLVTQSGQEWLGFGTGDSPTVGIGLNPRQFLESVTIDPRAYDWYVCAFQDYCRRAGFPIRPVRSHLYSTDVDYSTGVWD